MSILYPYWLSALIGPKDIADLYRTLSASDESFYYGFPISAPIYRLEEKDSKGFRGLTAEQKDNVAAALNYVSSVTSIIFQYATDLDRSNTLAIAANDQSAEVSLGYAYRPESNAIGSDIFIAIDPTNDTLSEDSEGALTLIHEIGHALGLKHPHELVGKSFGSILPTEEDHLKNTVMSYGKTSLQNFKFEFGALDLAALHYIYGPNPHARPLDDNYIISSERANFIWDGAGIDAIDASLVEQGVTIHLSPGYHDFIGEEPDALITSSGQITVNFGSILENLVGSNFDDSLFGNAEDNVITGNGGSDYIDAGDGLDTVIFGEPLSSIELSNTIDDEKLTWKISMANGDIDTLVNVERISLSDTRLALDLDGNAGKTAKLLGAFFGSEGVRNSALVGLGLQYLDTGLSYKELVDLAILTIFGESPNNREVIEIFYKNLTGQDAPEEVVGVYSSMLEKGDLSVLSLSLQVADSSINLASIDFIGLSTSGLEYN